MSEWQDQICAQFNRLGDGEHMDVCALQFADAFPAGGLFQEPTHYDAFRSKLIGASYGGVEIGVFLEDAIVRLIRKPYGKEVTWQPQDRWRSGMKRGADWTELRRPNPYKE